MRWAVGRGLPARRGGAASAEKRWRPRRNRLPSPSLEEEGDAEAEAAAAAAVDAARVARRTWGCALTDNLGRVLRASLGRSGARVARLPLLPRGTVESRAGFVGFRWGAAYQGGGLLCWFSCRFLAIVRLVSALLTTQPPQALHPALLSALLSVHVKAVGSRAM